MLTSRQILDTIALLGRVSFKNLVKLYGRSIKSKDDVRYGVHVLIGSNQIGFDIDGFMYRNEIILFVGKSK